MTSYTTLQWLSFFMIYCFFGWIFESCYCSIKSRKWVNRGFCRGPWIPLYGSGAVMMLFFTEPFKENLLLVYISGMIGATLLEFITGYVMHKLFKVRWWDYTKDPFNLGGYICLGASVAWGFLSIALTEFLQPLVLRFTQHWSHSFTLILLSLFYALFCTDAAMSFAAAWDIRSKIVALSRIKAEMAELLCDLESLGDDARAALHARAEDIRLSLHEQANLMQGRAETVMEQLQDAAGELREAMETHVDRLQDKTDELLESVENKIDRLQDFKEDLLENLGDRIDELQDRTETLKDALSEHAEQRQDALQAYRAVRRLQLDAEHQRRLSALQKKRLELAKQLNGWGRSMLRNNPGASSELPGFDDIRLYLRKKRLDFRIRMEDVIEELIRDAEDKRHDS